MRIYNSLLDLIGKTPLVKTRLFKGFKAEVVLKLESFNPMGSVKDRIAIQMVEDAEREGKLKPGMLVVESTSGNTGAGLALVCLLKGYKCVLTVPDKVSKEKIDLLKALGAEVVICPTNVPPESPESYYSVAKRIAEERGGLYINQYENPSNPKAHYLTTGPEIWEDTDGKVDVVVAGIGTGGTLTGVAKFLKEKKPSVESIAADPEGSVYYDYFYKGHWEEAHQYLIEGIGEDFIPSTIDFKYIDRIYRITDEEAYDWARKLAKVDGILSGSSAGAALCATYKYLLENDGNKLIVVIIPDSGFRYLSKVFNEDWLRQKGLL
ncbi:MAG: cysteine synthase family protein [candidate division WOR-3 bacterium]